MRENIVMRQFFSVLDTEDRENHSEILLNGSFFLSNIVRSTQKGPISAMSHFKLLETSVTDRQRRQI